jgi:riboflavin kinase/FMN adenylyltransferase
MRVIDDITVCEEHFPNLALTIGSFDGIHLGHRKILDATAGVAAELGDGTIAVMSLTPHPREFFSPGNAPNILTGNHQKEALLEAAGVDFLFYLPFDATVANMDRQEFLEEIVLRRCHARALVVGHDFAFGRGAGGNYEYLQEVAPQYNLDVRQVPPLIIQGERVSSTVIREYILQGELDRVETFLGRRYSLVGEVQRGRGMGRKLGFPTANVAPHNNALPAHGVYVGEAILQGERHQAAVNIGIAPTIRHDKPMVEAFLLDFERDIVGESIEIVFHKRLRPEKKYDSLDALIEAIHADVGDVRAWFAAHPLGG